MQRAMRQRDATSCVPTLLLLPRYIGSTYIIRPLGALASAAGLLARLLVLDSEPARGKGQRGRGQQEDERVSQLLGLGGLLGGRGFSDGSTTTSGDSSDTTESQKSEDTRDTAHLFSPGAVAPSGNLLPNEPPHQIDIKSAISTCVELARIIALKINQATGPNLFPPAALDLNPNAAGNSRSQGGAVALAEVSMVRVWMQLQRTASDL